MSNFLLTGVFVQNLACKFFEQGDLSRKNCQVSKLVRVDDATRETWQGIPVQVASKNTPAPHEQVLLDEFHLLLYNGLSTRANKIVKENLSSKTCLCGTGLTFVLLIQNQ